MQLKMRCSLNQVISENAWNLSFNEVSFFPGKNVYWSKKKPELLVVNNNFSSSITEIIKKRRIFPRFRILSNPSVLLEAHSKSSRNLRSTTPKYSNRIINYSEGFYLKVEPKKCGE